MRDVVLIYFRCQVKPANFLAKVPKVPGRVKNSTTQHIEPQTMLDSALSCILILHEVTCNALTIKSAFLDQKSQTPATMSYANLVLQLQTWNITHVPHLSGDATFWLVLGVLTKHPFCFSSF